MPTPAAPLQARPGVVLVYSLLVMAALLIVATGFSLYVTRATRTLAVGSNAAVATYLAESVVEEGLYNERRAGGMVPTGYIGSRSTFADPAALSLYKDFQNPVILLDVLQDEVAYVDVYTDVSGSNLTGKDVKSLKLVWEDGESVAWLEASLVQLKGVVLASAELLQPLTHVLGPSLSAGYCFNIPSELFSLKRLRFRALQSDIRDLRVTAYGLADCGGPNINLPSTINLSGSASYRGSTQFVNISMPRQTLPSGLFGFVVFSDQSLVKLNAGVGNLQFWPRIPNNFRWPDGTYATPEDWADGRIPFRFTYPNSVAPFAASSTASDIEPGFAGLRDLTDYPAGTPFFTLVNTAASGAFTSGDILLATSDSYAGHLALDYSFPTQLVVGQEVVSEPGRPGTTLRVKTCQALEVNGTLVLESFGATQDITTTDGDGNVVVVGSYYTDRCAVGVSLDPSGITGANPPLHGSLVAYADPGGTANVDISWDPPAPQLSIGHSANGSSWTTTTRDGTMDFGHARIQQPSTRQLRFCNTGDTQLTVGSVAVTQGTDYAVAVPTPFTVQPGDCDTRGSATFTPPVGAQPDVDYTGRITVDSNDPLGDYVMFTTGDIWRGKRIVITNGTHNGNFSSVHNFIGANHGSGLVGWEHADDFCNADTATESGVTWKALLYSWDSSDPGPLLSSGVIFSGKWYVNSQNQNLFQATTSGGVPADIGSPVTSTSNIRTWTGRTASYPGWGYRMQCDVGSSGIEWQGSDDGADNFPSRSDGGLGAPDSVDISWIQLGVETACSSANPNNFRHLYCVEQ